MTVNIFASVMLSVPSPIYPIGFNFLRLDSMGLHPFAILVGFTKEEQKAKTDSFTLRRWSERFPPIRKAPFHRMRFGNETPKGRFRAGTVYQAGLIGPRGWGETWAVYTWQSV